MSKVGKTFENMKFKATKGDDFLIVNSNETNIHCKFLNIIIYKLYAFRIRYLLTVLSKVAQNYFTKKKRRDKCRTLTLVLFVLKTKFATNPSRS